MVKRCTKCGKTKDVNDFNKKKGTSDGLDFWCRFCHGLCKKKYRENNKNKIKEYNRKYRSANKEKIEGFWIKYRDELPDHYIKKQLRRSYGLSDSEITPLLIEIKREHNLVLRKIKEAKNGLIGTGNKRT